MLIEVIYSTFSNLSLKPSFGGRRVALLFSHQDSFNRSTSHVVKKKLFPHGLYSKKNLVQGFSHQILL